jgi:hypothetical protein
VIPINRFNLQSPPIHLLAEFVGVLFDAFTNKPVSTAQLHIQMDLMSDIFIERQQALILCLWEIHLTPRNKTREDFI